MPEFTLMEAPVLAPGRCLGCGGHGGPVVDLMIRPDDPAFPPYLCEPCVFEAARLVGCLPPEDVASLTAAFAAAEERCRELDDLLVYERENKVVAVSDMAALVDRIREASASTAPAPAKEFLLGMQPGMDPIRDALLAERSLEQGAPAKCSETRVDGTPCTAEALPGRDVCLAHSKRKAAA